MATDDTTDQPAPVTRGPDSGKASRATPPVETQQTGRAGPPPPAEHGGPKGPEPTRYGDWERGGRCIDF